MFKLSATLTLFLCHSNVLALKKCNDSFTSLSLCTFEDNYDNGKPDFSQGKPFDVFNSISLLGINELDSNIKTISLNLLISVWWFDSRVTLRDKNPLDENGAWYSLRSDDESLEDIFYPVLKLGNVKSVERERKFGPKDVDAFSFKYPFHKLDFQQSLRATIYCPFDFEDFPFDSHICHFMLGSGIEYYNSLQMQPSKIRYKYLKSKIGDDGIDFKQDSIPYDIHLSAFEPYTHYEGGFNYSYCGMTIKLKRTHLGLLYSGFYYPTFVFAILSLVSFGINIDIVPGRLGLLITIYLISANVYNSVDGPLDRGFSYLEIWMIGTQIPILLAIFEYGILLILKRYRPYGITIKNESVEDLMEIDELAMILDKWTMVISFAYILIFSMSYWIPLSL